jgi:hypothetical protein
MLLDDPAPMPVYARAPGFALARAEASLASKPGDAPAEVVVRLAPGHRLTGRVTARGGEPVAEATVVVANGSLPLAVAFPETAPGTPYDARHANAWRDYARVAVESDGTFAVDGLPDGPYHVLAKAVPPDASLDPLRRRAEAIASASGVAAGGTVRLTLPFDVGAPVATLDLRFLDGDTDRRVLRPWGEVVAPPRRIAGRRVEPGVIRFEKVPVGTWQFFGGGDGFVSTSVPGIEVTAAPAIDRPPIRLVRGARVSGTIAGPDGAPYVGQVMLEPFDSGAGKIIVAARAAGRFEAEGVPPGTYRISGLAPSVEDGPWLAPHDGATVEVAPGAGEARFTGVFAPAGFLNVESRDPRFTATPPGLLLTEDQARLAGRSRLTISDPSGRVVAQRNGFGTTDPAVAWNGTLPPGPYVVRFAVPDERAIERRVEVVAGKRAQVTLPSP